MEVIKLKEQSQNNNGNMGSRLAQLENENHDL